VEIFKTQPYTVLRNWLYLTLLEQGDWTLRDAFQPQSFHEIVKTQEMSHLFTFAHLKYWSSATSLSPISQGCDRVRKEKRDAKSARDREQYVYDKKIERMVFCNSEKAK